MQRIGNGFSITVPHAGPYTIELHSVKGTLLAKRKGTGPDISYIPLSNSAPQAYILRLQTAGNRYIIRKIGL
jgi:hypothetical protein